MGLASAPSFGRSSSGQLAYAAEQLAQLAVTAQECAFHAIELGRVVRLLDSSKRAAAGGR